jgi:hypothetical protein
MRNLFSNLETKEDAMSFDLHHHIQIKGKPESIYQAITTAAGIKHWWTTDVTMDEEVGGRAVFGFGNHSTLNYSLKKASANPILPESLSKFIGQHLISIVLISDRNCLNRTKQGGIHEAI